MTKSDESIWSIVHSKRTEALEDEITSERSANYEMGRHSVLNIVSEALLKVHFKSPESLHSLFFIRNALKKYFVEKVYEVDRVKYETI